MEMPVYLFTGFLDAGKTKFIQETLEDPRFYDGERTLVILCEEGETEYDPSKFPSENVFFHTINEKDNLTKKELLGLQKKYRMQRVLIEYNGMWELNVLYENLPDNWLIYQQMMFAQAGTFQVYNTNMRNLMADKLRTAETVIFNRVNQGADLMQYHKEVRTFSRSAGIIYEYEDGKIEYDEIEDPLPFDIEADIIEIEDRDFAIWYRDLMEETDKYNGKRIRFKGIIAKDSAMPKNVYAIGRHIMTCCADDISFGALILIYNGQNEFNTRDWALTCAQIRVEYNEIYNSKGPVLYAESLDAALAPEQELATFY